MSQHLLGVEQVGPRLSFSTAWAANAASICRSCGLEKVSRIEISRRYLLRADLNLAASDLAVFAAMVRSIGSSCLWKHEYAVCMES